MDKFVIDQYSQKVLLGNFYASWANSKSKRKTTKLESIIGARPDLSDELISEKTSDEAIRIFELLFPKAGQDPKLKRRIKKKK